MTLYIVTCHEEVIFDTEVEADSPEEAVRIAEEGDEDGIMSDQYNVEGGDTEALWVRRYTDRVEVWNKNESEME